MTGDMREDSCARQILCDVFPDGMHEDEVAAQWNDIHEFVTKYEAQERQKYDACTPAECVTLPIRRMYAFLARHSMHVQETDGTVVFCTVVALEELVVYLAKGLLPRLPIAAFDQACFSNSTKFMTP
eukprot:6212885-Pleurochrysis_carterae.AAC.2